MSDEIGLRGGATNIRDSLSVASEAANRDTPQIYEFGPFRLEPSERKLLRGNEIVALTPKAFDTLVLLVRNSGHLIEKDELLRRLWPDSFVEEGSLSTNIFMLRKALGEDPPFIETVSRRGYRFVAPVERSPDSAEAAAVDHQKRPKPIFQRRWIAIVLLVPIMIGAVAAALLLGLNVRGWRSRLFSGPPKPKIQALAVLPLANLSGDPEQEYFADGMTDSLITELGKISSPRVISRQSIMQYKGSKKGLPEIARELNVDAVLEGAVGHSGDRVKITVHLAQASPERQLWAQEYDRSIRDVLSLQGEIARAIADEIQVKLTPEERTRLAVSRSVDPEAQDNYLRGLYFTSKYTELGYQTAIAHFKTAIAKEPTYAPAYAELAMAYFWLGNPDQGGPSARETMPQAKAAVTKALELDPSLARAHLALGLILLNPCLPEKPRNL